MEIKVYDCHGRVCGATQAISKQIRGYDNRIGLLEEMADAYICLEFLKSIFDITPEELQKAMDVKLQRERNKQR